MNAQDRAHKIESYGNAYSQLVGALKQFPADFFGMAKAAVNCPGE